ncbi:hypothetical protein HCN51_28400 [Nonomuraea sp. FMUSA5-5]|uniref:Uncharacterized protein n=1 Tax=Nonomuraea composti TaxID=2720023 RepID=A0ABX1B9X3_9ACTN|nr:hypothetical protein [Nonomuraea sp. FMUSA5-5]NJP93320.1 hypothetical protein [Nonomuraea sp. FMUSA5-5]
MSWELPSGLRAVHGLVASDAPWPRADETRRLDGAGSWMDLAAATQGGRTESASAVSQVRASGNHSGDLSVFESAWSGTDARMGDGALANALVGTGTTAVVVLRTVWKYVVVLSLIALLLSIIRAFALGPALGALFTRMRVMGTRKALQVTLAQIERNIAGNAVAALRLAKRMLARGLIVPGLQTALVVADTLALDPFDDNSRAREEAEHVLRQTPEGRAALAYAKEHGITTLYQSGQNIYASDYDRGLNVIRIGGADWSTPEALAGEFVRQVEIAKSRWSPSPLGTSLDEYTEARSREEEAANRAAYRMGAQLGYEQDARATYGANDFTSYGADSGDVYGEHENGLEQAILDGPFKLFNDGPLDFTR